MPAGGTKEADEEEKVDDEEDATVPAIVALVPLLVDKLTVVLGVKEVTFDVEGEEDEQEVDGGWKDVPKEASSDIRSSGSNWAVKLEGHKSDEVSRVSDSLFGPSVFSCVTKEEKENKKKSEWKEKRWREKKNTHKMTLWTSDRVHIVTVTPKITYMR